MALFLDAEFADRHNTRYQQNLSNYNNNKKEMSTKQIAALICRTYKDIKNKPTKKETLNIIMI